MGRTYRARSWGGAWYFLVAAGCALLVSKPEWIHSAVMAYARFLDVTVTPLVMRALGWG